MDASNDDLTYNEQQVSGLKQAIGKQANLRRDAEKTLAEMNSLFAQSIGAMFEMDVATDKMEKLIWDYVRINELWWRGQSEKVGVFSHIGDYTNKKGRTSKAHYSENGKYLKPAKEGDEPISYEGYFRITPEGYDYDIYTKDDKWVLEFEPK